MSTTRITQNLSSFDKLSEQGIKEKIFDFLDDKSLHQLSFVSNTFKTEIRDKIDYEQLIELKKKSHCLALNDEKDIEFPHEKFINACNSKNEFIQIFIPTFNLYLKKKKEKIQSSSVQEDISKFITEPISLFLHYFLRYPSYNGIRKLPIFFDDDFIELLLFFYREINKLLKQAIRNDDIHSVSELIKKGACIDFTQLLCDLFDSVKNLEKEYKKLDKITDEVVNNCITRKLDDDLCSPLVYSANFGNKDIFELLIRENVKLNYEPPLDDTCKALTISANKGFFEIVKLLVEKYQFRLGIGYQPPFFPAMVNCHFELANFLYPYTDVDCRMGVFQYVISHQNTPAINKFLENKWVSFNDISESYRPGTWYSEECCYEFVRYLLSIGFDPNVKSSKNETPLMAVLNRKHYKTAELLINHGANLDGAWEIINNHKLNSYEIKEGKEKELQAIQKLIKLKQGIHESKKESSNRVCDKSDHNCRIL